jgi:hypothetical protein
MLTERYFASVSGPPISNNTAAAKDVGVYEHTLHPSHSTANTFKKGSVPRNCLAVNDTHIFTAQDEKSTVHVYSRAKGNQEATVTFQERIKSVALLDDILVLGTEGGRIIIWEVCRQQLPTSRNNRLPRYKYADPPNFVGMYRPASHDSCVPCAGSDLHCIHPISSHYRFRRF